MEGKDEMYDCESFKEIDNLVLEGGGRKGGRGAGKEGRKGKPWQGKREGRK